MKNIVQIQSIIRVLTGFRSAVIAAILTNIFQSK